MRMKQRIIIKRCHASSVHADPSTQLFTYFRRKVMHSFSPFVLISSHGTAASADLMPFSKDYSV